MFYTLRNVINYLVGDDRRHMTSSELMALHESGKELPVHPVLHAEKNKIIHSDSPLPAGYRPVHSQSTIAGVLSDIKINGTLELRDNSFTCINVKANKVIAKTKNQNDKIEFFKTSIPEITCDNFKNVAIKEDHTLKNLIVDQGKILSVESAENLQELDMYDLLEMKVVDLKKTPKLRNTISLDVFHLNETTTAVASIGHFVVGKFSGTSEEIVEKYNTLPDDAEKQLIIASLQKAGGLNGPA